MNCKDVMDLLPLYVGGDIEVKKASMITAHVQSCAGCGSSADEYRESHQLTQLFAAPEFDEAVYDGIREHVFREIARDSANSKAHTLSHLVAGLFQPRLRWAIAAALLLAVSTLAFYFIANSENVGQQIVINGTTPDETKQNAQANPTPRIVTPSVVSEVRDQRRLPGNKGTGRKTGAHPTGDVATHSSNARQPASIPVRAQTISGRPLRVELQTNDPNIRIIWFSQQLTTQDSPAESSKGI